MDAAPYYAPTYFAASFFYSAASSAPASTSMGVLPYNAPTYFPPSYFYGNSSATASAVLPYNAPTYFPPSYFYWSPTSVTGSEVLTPDPVGGDHTSFLTLIELLDATGLFEEVIFGAATQRSQAGADTYPLAVLTPKGWEESDEVDPISIVRRVTFSITVVVTSHDGLPQFDQLNRLSYAIKTAVDGSSLDGTCLPALTRIRSGHYMYSNHYPEQSIELEGEFSSIIDPAAYSPAAS